MIEYFCCMNLSNSSRIIGLSISFMKGWILFIKRGGINSSLPFSFSLVAIEYPMRVYLYILSIHSRTIRVLYSEESPSLLDKALIAQNKALPAVLLPESLIPVMTVKPPTSIEACLILFILESSICIVFFIMVCTNVTINISKN